MTIMNERIEAAFLDEYQRIKHEGIEKLLEQSIEVILFTIYRRGYIRGHSARSKEVQQDEEQARREGKYPMGVEVRYEGNKLILGGKDVTPSTPPTRPPSPEYRPEAHR